MQGFHLSERFAVLDPKLVILVFFGGFFSRSDEFLKMEGGGGCSVKTVFGQETDHRRSFCICGDYINKVFDWKLAVKSSSVTSPLNCY